MVRKTTADLAALRAVQVERRRVAAYRATEGHTASRLAEMVEAHQCIAALDAVIADGGDGMDVDTFADLAAAFVTANR